MAAEAPRGTDLALWAAAQARLLRESRLEDVDAPGVAPSSDLSKIRDDRSLPPGPIPEAFRKAWKR